MKRVLLVLALSLLAVVFVGSEALGAPTAVSLKSGIGIVGLYGIEVAVPVSEHFAVVGQAGTIFPFGTVLSAIFTLGNAAVEYATVGAGIRYYFAAEGWRPFVSAYCDYNFELYGTAEAANFFNFPVTAGIEYQRERGFHFALELGGCYTPSNTDEPLALAVGLALGYGF